MKKKLQEWIPKFSNQMEVIYSAKKHGFDCRSYLDKCENLGNLVFLIQTTLNDIFGGFVSLPLIINNQKFVEIQDPNCFIFIANIGNQEEYIKCELKKNEPFSFSFAFDSNRGPLFGEGWDLGVEENMKILSMNFGVTFEKPKIKMSEEAKRLLSSEFKKFEIEEIEIYTIPKEDEKSN
eukprot:Anaeramoba_ignava/c6758_g1_i1.p1 GENE.c6758_g1_i1~~c6758_g1_i1.p1  ORF type:complete len:179 (+),score=81.11 c6758_g1_i1:182-718(+)